LKKQVKEGSAMPLTMVARGMVRVLRVEGGFGMMDKLKPMGILPGENIEIIRNDSSGPLIISVKGSRLVIGRGMAQKIHVK
jgi:Fe2+ transport system protein FeoA